MRPMRNSEKVHDPISISSSVSVQYRLHSPTDLNFTHMSSRLAANHFMHIDFNLTLVAKCSKFSTQEPVLVFGLGTIEVLCGTTQHTLVHSALCLGSDANVVLAIDHQLIDDVIAVCALFTLCKCLCHVSIIARFYQSVNQRPYT
jgi:hypothetical protein